MKVTIHNCTNCGGRLAHIKLVEGITRSGTILGNELIKCENGCNKADILKPEPVVMTDPFFMEMISYARSIGKKISKQDLNREMNIFQRGRG